jgi:hypothetical protein
MGDAVPLHKPEIIGQCKPNQMYIAVQNCYPRGRNPLPMLVLTRIGPKETKLHLIPANIVR